MIEERQKPKIFPVAPPHEFTAPTGGLRLNIGCGFKHIEGWVNIDSEEAAQPDVVHDLEQHPWTGTDGPLEDSSVDEIIARHAIEHIGETIAGRKALWQEMYRVLKPNGLLHISVPHPFSWDAIGDPTHVNLLTPNMLHLFDKKICEGWIAIGAANSPLAFYWDIDFELLQKIGTPNPLFTEKWKGEPEDRLLALMNEQTNFMLNVCSELRFVLRARKGE